MQPRTRTHTRAHTGADIITAGMGNPTLSASNWKADSAAPCAKCVLLLLLLWLCQFSRLAFFSLFSFVFFPFGLNNWVWVGRQKQKAGKLHCNTLPHSIFHWHACASGVRMCVCVCVTGGFSFGFFVCLCLGLVVLCASTSPAVFGEWSLEKLCSARLFCQHPPSLSGTRPTSIPLSWSLSRFRIVGKFGWKTHWCALKIHINMFALFCTAVWSTLLLPCHILPVRSCVCVLVQMCMCLSALGCHCLLLCHCFVTVKMTLKPLNSWLTDSDRPADREQRLRTCHPETPTHTPDP